MKEPLQCRNAGLSSPGAAPCCGILTGEAVASSWACPDHHVASLSTQSRQRCGTGQLLSSPHSLPSLARLLTVSHVTRWSFQTLRFELWIPFDYQMIIRSAIYPYETHAQRYSVQTNHFIVVFRNQLTIFIDLICIKVCFFRSEIEKTLWKQHLLRRFIHL